MASPQWLWPPVFTKGSGNVEVGTNVQVSCFYSWKLQIWPIYLLFGCGIRTKARQRTLARHVGVEVKVWVNLSLQNPGALDLICRAFVVQSPLSYLSPTTFDCCNMCRAFVVQSPLSYLSPRTFGCCNMCRAQRLKWAFYQLPLITLHSLTARSICTQRVKRYPTSRNYVHSMKDSSLNTVQEN